MARRNKKKRPIRSKKYSVSFATRIPTRSPNLTRLLHKHRPITPNIFRTVSKKIRSRIYSEKRRIPNDRRFWRPKTNPEKERYGAQDQRIHYVLRAKIGTGGKGPKTRLGFSHPKRVEICRRRARRREALFRQHKVGKGVKVTTPKNLNIYSRIRC